MKIKLQHEEITMKRLRVIKRKGDMFIVKYEKKIFKEITECPYCLDEYKDGDEVSPLPCDVRHVFHTSCVLDWIKVHR